MLCPVRHEVREPLNMRRQPAEWKELLTESDRLLIEELPDVAAELLHAEVAELNDEALDTNRYFAIGEIMRVTASYLRQPHYWQFAVSSGSDAIVKDRCQTLSTRAQSTVDLPKLQMGSLMMNSKRFGSGLADVMEGAQMDLTPAAQLLANVLYVEQRKRLNVAGFVPASKKLLSLQEIEGVTGESFAATSIGPAAMSSMLRVYRSIITAQRGLPLNSRTCLVGHEDFRDIDPMAVSARYAAMHLHEFIHHTRPTNRHNGVFRDEAGAWRVPSDILVYKEPVVRETKVLHTETLRCPALHVTGFLLQVAGLSADILEATQQKLASKTTGP